MGDAREAGLRERLARAPLAVDAAAQVEQALARLGEAGLSASERASLLSWLETVLTLPWTPTLRPRIDLGALRTALERATLGQREAKERILEGLAAGALRPDGRVPPMCLVGPPGVGKSHLAEALAEALGRPSVHVRLGGATQTSDLLGRRRMSSEPRPGRVLEALVRAGVRDPVLIFDGIDRFVLDAEGDAVGALLPLLDPDERTAFRDRWLGLPIDLSRAIVVCTSYVVDVLPLEFKDRLLFVGLRGYTDAEKRAIARAHLLPVLAAEAGLLAVDARLSDDTLQALIDGWTFETGVRGLRRRLLAVLRYLALRRALGEPGPFDVAPADLSGILGPRSQHKDRVERMCVPGVALGLAWTPAGGQLLFIEASAVPGRGNLKLTGSLGEVMKESAEAATTWLREYAPSLGNVLQMDLHVHVPEGAVPKDGPSAGIALLVAIVSAISGNVVRHDLAMTGEITLRGQVLPVGGIREKVLAAQRAGIRALVLPRRNQEDLADVPPEILAQLDLHFVERVEEALGPAFGRKGGVPKVARDERDGRKPATAPHPAVRPKVRRGGARRSAATGRRARRR
jgi:ATP-dependent Lon protease